MLLKLSLVYPVFVIHLNDLMNFCTNGSIYIAKEYTNTIINSNAPAEYAIFEASEHRMNFHDDSPQKYCEDVLSDKVSNFIQDGDEFLNVDNHQSTKDAQLIDSCSEASTKKTKSRSVYLRRDVVNKAIFRALNKFYNKMFKYRTSYKGKSRDTLYNKFTSHVTKVFESHQTKATLNSQTRINGKLENIKSLIFC